MLKRHLLICALLSSTSLHAGFYLGAGVGPDYEDFTHQATIIKNDPDHVQTNFYALDKTHLSAVGAFATLFAGYEYIDKTKFYIAAELNGNLSSTEFKSSNDEFVHQTFIKTSFRMTNMLGVSVLPGYQYSDDTLFYGRVGYASGRFKSRTSDITAENTSMRLDGFRWGLGGKQAVSEHFALRLEYSQVHYQSINFNTYDPAGFVAKTTKMTPFDQMVEFGLVYSI